MSRRLSLAVLAGLALLSPSGCGSGGPGSPPAAPTGVPNFKSETNPIAHATDSVSLQPGWNALGFRGLPVTAVNTTEVAGFAFFNGTAYETTSLTVEEINRGEGTRRGLWVFAVSPTTMNYVATDVVNVTTTSTLRAGWNLLAFPSSAPVPGNSLVVKSGGSVVTLTSVILPQFSQINPDRTYTTVDVSTGGSLTPGRAYWVYAASPVTLSWGTGPSASPSPSPGASPSASPTASVLPGASPTPAASPSPGASPTPVTSPSPGTSPTPAASPSPGASLVSVRYNITDMGVWKAISNDGQSAVATRDIGFGSTFNRLQDLNLAAGTLTEDTSSFASTNNQSGVEGVFPSAECSTSWISVRTFNSPPNILFGIHQRGTNTSTQTSVGGRLYTPRDVNADGTLLAFYVTDTDGNGTPYTTTGSNANNLLDSNSGLTFLNSYSMERNCLSDSGSQVLLRETNRRFQTPSFIRYLRTNVGSNGATLAIPDAEANEGISDASLSGNGQFVAYSTSDGVTSQVYVRDIDAQSARQVISRTSAGNPGNGNSWFSNVSGRKFSSDGRFVLFASEATDLVPGATGRNLFLRDRLNGTTTRMNVSETGAVVTGWFEAGMSRNGQWIYFQDLGAGSTFLRVRNPAL